MQDSAEVTTVVGNATTIAYTTKRLSIIKPVSSKTASPFLINKSDLNLGHLSRRSFLNRDSPILEKLASLSKSGGDNDVILNKPKGKGNYVFVATEKKDVRFIFLEYSSLHLLTFYSGIFIESQTKIRKWSGWNRLWSAKSKQKIKIRSTKTNKNKTTDESVLRFA